MAKKLYTDQNLCISCSHCVDTVPEVFRMNRNGYAEAYQSGGAPAWRIQRAIDICPVHGIYWA